MANKFIILGAAAAVLSGCALLVEQGADRTEYAAEQKFPPLGRILDVGGVPVHAYVTGSGPDLVLIHGASGNLRDFTFSFVDRVKDRYRVIVFDRPGLGYTGRTDPKYAQAFGNEAESPREQARLLQAAAAQLGAEAPIVLGQSYGGAVAMAWALEQPDMLSGLVVVSGATNPWEGGLGPLYRINSSALGGVTAVPIISAVASEGTVSKVLDSVFEPNPVPDGYNDYIGAALTLRRDSLRANARQVNALKGHVTEMSKHYQSVRVPLEIVHGTADTVVGAKIHAEPLSQMVPGANLTLLDGIGHMPHHSAPEAVEAAIDRAAARAGLR